MQRNYDVSKPNNIGKAQLLPEDSSALIGVRARAITVAAGAVRAPVPRRAAGGPAAVASRRRRPQVPPVGVVLRRVPGHELRVLVAGGRAGNKWQGRQHGHDGKSECARTASHWLYSICDTL